MVYLNNEEHLPLGYTYTVLYLRLSQLIFNIPQPLTFIVILFNYSTISLFLSYVISTTFLQINSSEHVHLLV